MNFRRCAFGLCVFLLLRCAIPAGLRCAEPRDTSAFRLAVYSGASLLLTRADFNSLPGIERSSSLGAQPYNSGSGFVFTLGAATEVDLAESLALYAAVEYNRLDGTLEATESFIYATETGRGEGQFNYALLHNLQFFSLQSGLRFYPFTNSVLKPLSLSGGLNAGFILTSSAQQQIDLAFPTDIDLVNGQPADSPEVSFQNPSGIVAGLQAGLMYDFVVGDNIWLSPGIAFDYALSSYETSVDWKNSALRFTLQLSRRETEPWPLEIERFYQRDTLIDIVSGIESEDIVLDSRRVDSVERVEQSQRRRVRRLDISEVYKRRIPAPQPLLSASIESRFVLADGAEAANADLPVRVVEVLHARRLLPLLDCEVNNGAAAPPRLAQFNSSLVFCPPDVSLDTLADRLAAVDEAAEAVLTVHSNCPDAASQAWRTAQAAHVKRRLNSEIPLVFDAVFNSDAARPPLQLEMPVVELAARPAALVAPALARDVRRYVQAPHIRFAIDVVSEAGIAAWKLSIKQNDRLLKLFTGSSSPPQTLEWDAAAPGEAWFGDEADLVFVLSISDRDGQSWTSDAGLIRIGARAVDGRPEELNAAARVLRFPLNRIAAGRGDIPSLTEIFGVLPGLNIDRVAVYGHDKRNTGAISAALARLLGLEADQVSIVELADPYQGEGRPAAISALEREFLMVEIWAPL